MAFEAIWEDDVHMSGYLRLYPESGHTHRPSTALCTAQRKKKEDTKKMIRAKSHLFRGIFISGHTYFWDGGKPPSDPCPA